MADHIVTLSPRPGDYKWDVFYNNEKIVNSSTDPEHKAARALSGMGYSGSMQTVGLDGKPRMFYKDLEATAARCIVEPARGGLYVGKHREFDGLQK